MGDRTAQRDQAARAHRGPEQVHLHRSQLPRRRRGGRPADPHVLELKLWVNGAQMQNGNTKTFIFDVRYLVSYLSNLITLSPGDLIATGTPPGVGFARKPPVFLQPGDSCRLEITGLGTLEN